MYPIIPKITNLISKEDLDKLEFPKINKTKNNKKIIKDLMNFNSKVWKMKKDSNISLRDPIQNINIPSNLKDFEKDLKACHKI